MKHLTNEPDDIEALKRGLMKPASDAGRAEQRRRQFEEFWGQPISVYTDSNAIDDGILIPFRTRRGDTGHRITSNAFHSLNEHHRPAYPTYEDGDFLRFYFCELLALIPAALACDRRGSYLTTNFDFRVQEYSGGTSDQLWYVPNEIGGITMMRPDDY